jgi:hypothetical protein
MPLLSPLHAKPSTRFQLAGTEFSNLGGKRKRFDPFRLKIADRTQQLLELAFELGKVGWRCRGDRWERLSDLRKSADPFY